MVSEQELEQSAAQLADFRAENDKHHTALSELLEKYSTLMQDHKRLQSDLEEERDSREKYKQLAKGSDRNPFVLVLVDGDGYVFDDVSDGAEGGQRAAQLLNDAVRNSLRNRGLDHCNVMVRVYANVAGLSKALSKNKLAGPEKRSIAPFVANFNRSNELFDYVDAGELKENADFKIRAVFRQFAENAQCKQIYFAACHDVGYISELAPHVGNRDRITLVRTPAFHREFAKLNLRVEDFHSVFRNTPLDMQMGISPGKIAQPPNAQPNAASTVMDTAPFCSFYQKGMCKYGKGCKFKHVKLSTNGHTSSTSLSEIKDWRQGSSSGSSALPFDLPKLTKTDNDFMTSNISTKDDQIAGSTDFAAALPQAGKIPAGQVPINQRAQRLDPYIPTPPSGKKAEFYARIAKQKMCNSYHIYGVCPNGEACSYDHQPASPNIIDCLKQVVLNNPCPRRGTCRSLTCLYGHICQKPDCKYRGGNIFCKFPPQIHYQDLNLSGFEPGITKNPLNGDNADTKELTGSPSGSGNGNVSPPAASPTLSTSDGEVEEGEGQGALLAVDDDASVD